MKKLTILLLAASIAPAAQAQLSIGTGGAAKVAVGADANVNTNVNHGINTIDNARTTVGAATNVEADVTNNTSLGVSDDGKRKKKLSSNRLHDRRDIGDQRSQLNADVSAEAHANNEVRKKSFRERREADRIARDNLKRERDRLKEERQNSLHNETSSERLEKLRNETEEARQERERNRAIITGSGTVKASD